MPENNILVSSGSGNPVDVFTLNNPANLRQSVVVGDSAINANVAPVQATDPSSSSQGLVVRDVNTSAIVGKLTSGVTVTPSGTFAVYFDQSQPTVKAIPSTGTFQVQFDPGHTLGKIEPGVGTFQVFLPDTGHEIGSIRGINSSVGVYFDHSSPLVGVISANTTANSDGINAGQLVTSGGGAVNNPISVALYGFNGVNFDRLRDGSGVSNAALRVVQAVDIVSSVNIMGIGTSNTLSVFFPDTGHEIGSIRGNTNTLTVFLPDTGHTIGKADQGVGSLPNAWFINALHTASIFTVSGSASGVSVSGNTIISPSASYSFKIFAINITTTAQDHIVAKFTNGAGTSPTEYWRYALQAPSQGIAGANLAVSVPSYIFATGTSTTLSLVLDTASLVHYSIAYIKESA